MPAPDLTQYSLAVTRPLLDIVDTLDDHTIALCSPIRCFSTGETLHYHDAHEYAARSFWRAASIALLERQIRLYGDRSGDFPMIIAADWYSGAAWGITDHQLSMPLSID